MIQIYLNRKHTSELLETNRSNLKAQMCLEQGEDRDVCEVLYYQQQWCNEKQLIIASPKACQEGGKEEVTLRYSPVGDEPLPPSLQV